MNSSGTLITKNNRRVIIIAMDQPIDSDAHFRGKMANAENRAKRQSPRFPDLDLLSIQKKVHQNLSNLPLALNGRYLGLLDLMNTIKNHREFPVLSRENAPEYHLFANEITLNGIFLYQYLLQKGFDPDLVQNVSLVDLSEILNDPPLAACISSTFLYLDDIREIATEIKGINPEIPVIVGGILAKKVLDAGRDISPQTMNWLSGFFKKVDAFVVETNGEQTLLKLLGALSKGQDLDGIPNLVFFDDLGKAVFTRREGEPADMDRTAILWDRIPKKYLRKTLSVVTSRGCSYRCRFCTYHHWFPKVLYKSVEALREELLRVQRLGFVRHIRFADDNFTADPRRLKAVLEMMIREGFDFAWSSYARASAINPENLRLMKDSGCDLLVMGIESGSETVLRNMDKRLKPRQALEAIQGMREHGIDSQGGFVIGFPGETEKTFRETVDLINESGLKYYHPYLFYYSKDMLVHREGQKFGLNGLGLAWRHNTMDSIQASELMSRMPGLIDKGFTDGQQNTWETYKLLRGEGYSRDKIHALFRLKRELYLALKRSGETGKSSRIEEILNQFESEMLIQELSSF